MEYLVLAIMMLAPSGVLWWMLRIERQATRDVRASWREATKRSDAAIDRMYAREEKLVAQVQDLSQRLASIRVEHPGADSDDKVYDIPEPPKPYSEDLQRFLSGIESEDARLLVEEQVESLRQRSLTDEYILDRVSAGEDIY